VYQKKEKEKASKCLTCRQLLGTWWLLFDLRTAFTAAWSVQQLKYLYWQCLVNGRQQCASFCTPPIS